MVVDDAIVVLENISKHIDRGSSPREASIYATNEVWVSVIATTLVIVAVFVPLTMLTGMAGILFKELGWIVTIVVCTSTATAISLIPMLCSQILKGKNVKVVDGKLIETKPKDNFYQKYIVSFLDKVDAAYANLLRWCVNHKAATLAIAVAFFFLSLIPAMTGRIGTDFMQSQDNGRLTVIVEVQRGTRIEETAKTARHLEQRFMELVPEIERISTTAGSNDESNISVLFSSTTNYKIQMTVVCCKKYERKRSISEIAEVLRQEMATYPQIIEYNVATSGGMGGQGESTVDVEIYGYDFASTSAMAEKVKYLCQQLPAARDVTISRQDDRPEIKITVDKEKATRLGLTSASISTYLRSRVNGMNCGYLKEDGSEYDILVRLKEENRNSIEDIADLTIPTGMGGRVKLSEVASIGEYWAPPTIERKARQRVVTITVFPYEVSLGELANEIETKVMPEIEFPTGYSYRLAGTFETQQETFGNMGLLALLIIILVYIVMASQFESFAKPGIIMFAIPLLLRCISPAIHWI